MCQFEEENLIFLQNPHWSVKVRIKFFGRIPPKCICMDLFSSLVYKDIQVHTHTHTHTPSHNKCNIFQADCHISSNYTNEILSVDLLAVQFITRFQIIFKKFIIVFLFSVLSVLLLFLFVSSSVIKIQKYSLLLHKCYIITITISNSLTILDHTRVCRFGVKIQGTRWFYCLFMYTIIHTYDITHI